MQVIDPLTIEDFDKDSILVISKVEIDSDGAGNFQELPDVKTYNISTNEENRVAKFCSYSFNITCLNTDDRYDPLNSGSSNYNWLKQGRRIKLWAGIEKNETPYPYQLILGRIDNFKLGKRAGQDICTITGRCLMRMVLDFKLYSPYTYWGTSAAYNTVANKIRYDMPADEAGCKGVYKVELDYTNKDGTALEEIFENSDWSYDWHNNQLVFTSRRIPDFAGTNNLKVYYFQEQSVEDVVADILIGSGILQAEIEATTISFLDNDPDPDTILDSNKGFVTAGFRSGQIITVDTTSGTNDGIYTISTVTPGVITLIESDPLTTEDAATAGTVTITTEVNLVSKTEWLASSSVDPIDKTIHRVWFNAGTSALKAITLLSEVVQYRFYFDYAGNPIFKLKPSAGSVVNTISDYEARVENVEGNVDETYTHIIVIGEERDRVLGDDETAPVVPDNLALTTGFGETTQAGLAYIEATWDANTESDFGHYELRIKKNADAYYTEVSTITNTYIFYGIESGVTYNVQVRAVDIYNNRSDWSPVENIVSATDSSTPAKIAGETATAILAGIKIEWTRSPEDNIAYYLIERQESSEDNGEWSNWTEKVRIRANMWLDLLLTYSNWYRYRITAYTVAGVAGVTSDSTTAVQPNQAGADDIVAKCITADQIYGNKLSVIFADMGSITAGDITLNSSGFIRTSGKTSYDSEVAGFWLGYSAGYKLNIGNATRYLKWTGANLEVKGDLLGGVIDGAELRIGGYGSDQEIYFKDSAIHLYDYAFTDYQRIGFRIGALTFARLYYQTVAEAPAVSALRLEAGDYQGAFQVQDDGEVWIDNYDGTTHRWFGFYTGGTFHIPSIALEPTGHEADLSYNGTLQRFQGYIGGEENAWGYWLLNTGW